MKSIKLLTFCLLLLLAACRKDEFMPEAEGQPVPAEELTVTIKELLNRSSYTLFKAAWERSDMNAIIKTKGAKFPYTLLVPTDAAFIAEGLTLEVINTTTPALLDSILLYHTIDGNIIATELRKSEGRYTGKTLLENSNLKVKPAISGSGPYDIYAYLQYLKISDEELFINGKTAGKIAPQQAKDGLLLPIDRVLHKPTKTILQILREDGRFGMYLELNERSDALYTELSEYAFTHDFTADISLHPFANYNLTFTSIFAVPDEVFQQAGFNTVDEIMALNDRNPLPYLDYNTFTMVGGLASDSLIAYHRWGTSFAETNPSSGGGIKTGNNFYTNDMTNALLSDYTLVNGNNGIVRPYLNPLNFSQEGGSTKVSVKGSDYPAATITEGNINSLMGPMHVVDRLILPKGFKLK